MGAISNRVSGGLPLSAAIIHALPAILYGVRIAASASIALYIAFFLQMDQPMAYGLRWPSPLGLSSGFFHSGRTVQLLLFSS
jgi:hypothetical protein